jgi:hypothetical protein
MSEVIDLKEKPVVLRWTCADVEIDGRQLELAVCHETDRPMVIDWRTERAWVGPWDELVGDVAEQLREEVPHGR